MSETVKMAYVLDFDATLFYVDADIKVIDSNTGAVRLLLTPTEYNTYKTNLKSDEYFNFDDFDNPVKIKSARLTPFFKSFKKYCPNLDDVDIYIITARRGKSNKELIHWLICKHLKNIPLQNVCMAGDIAESYQEIPKAKAKILGKISTKYNNVAFIDDDIDNIRYVASEMKNNIISVHVSNFEIGFNLFRYYTNINVDQLPYAKNYALDFLFYHMTL